MASYACSSVFIKIQTQVPLTNKTFILHLLVQKRNVIPLLCAYRILIQFFTGTSKVLKNILSSELIFPTEKWPHRNFSKHLKPHSEKASGEDIKFSFPFNALLFSLSLSIIIIYAFPDASLFLKAFGLDWIRRQNCLMSQPSPLSPSCLTWIWQSSSLDSLYSCLSDSPKFNSLVNFIHSAGSLLGVLEYT